MKWKPFFEIEKFDKHSCVEANNLRKSMLGSATADMIEDLKMMTLFPVRLDHENKKYLAAQLKDSEMICKCGFDHVVNV